MDDAPDADSSRGQDVPRSQATQIGWRERWPALAAAVSDVPPEGSGVYFLERSDAIVYVGSSTYPSKRVYLGHERCQGKDFAAVWFLPVDEGELIATERHWIRTLTPVHNKAWNPSPDPAFPGWGQDPNAEGHAVNFRVTDDRVWDALQAFLSAQRVPPRMTQVMLCSLKEFLRAEGFYPPKG